MIEQQLASRFFFMGQTTAAYDGGSLSP